MSRRVKGMLWALPFCGMALLAAVGCQSQPAVRSQADAALFGPVSMRIHPIFTSIKDWTGDDKPDGVEALLELQDQFGDPTKASGRVLFELFEYKRYEPDPRGERLALWPGELGTLEDQQARWNRTTRTYRFQLKYDGIDPTRGYVLTATFELSGGGRFFDRTLLEPRPAPSDRPNPSTGPADSDPAKESTGATTAPAVILGNPGNSGSGNPGNAPGSRVPAP